MQTLKHGRLPLPLAPLLALLLLASCSGGGSQNSAAAPAPAPVAPVATVNGRAIPAKVYEMFLRNGREALGINEATDEGRRKLGELREGIVSELIDRALIMQEAERRGLRVTPEMLAGREGEEITKLGGTVQQLTTGVLRFTVNPLTGTVSVSLAK